MIELYRYHLMMQYFVLCCTGTLISAFTVLCGAHSELIPERGVCCVFWLNVAAAVIQILTAVIMVGWIMSIFWGMDMVILASQFLFLVFSIVFGRYPVSDESITASLFSFLPLRTPQFLMVGF